MPLSPVYAIYAFHSLDASLTHSKTLRLAHVDDLWNSYLQAHPTLEVSSSLEDADAETEENDEDEDADATSDGMHTSQNQHDLIDNHIDENASSRDTPHAPSPSPSASSSSTPSSHRSTANSSRTTLSSSSSSHSSSANNSNNNTSDRTSTFRKAVRGLARSRRNDRTLPTSEQKPLFVTWNDLSRPGQKVLRGCIGTFDGQEIEKGLRTYALTAALEDTRFAPISPSELPHLGVSITYLTDFEPCANGPMDWELGVHGLRISFTWRNQRLGATYLPSVAVEQGWSKTETMISLMRKAGWNGRREEWMRVQDLHVVRYRGVKCGVTWGEYKAWKDWCEIRP